MFNVQKWCSSSFNVRYRLSTQFEESSIPAGTLDEFWKSSWTLPSVELTRPCLLIYSWERFEVYLTARCYIPRVRPRLWIRSMFQKVKRQKSIRHWDLCQYLSDTLDGYSWKLVKSRSISFQVYKELSSVHNLGTLDI